MFNYNLTNILFYIQIYYNNVKKYFIVELKIYFCLFQVYFIRL